MLALLTSSFLPALPTLLLPPSLLATAALAESPPLAGSTLLARPSLALLAPFASLFLPASLSVS